jgi:hypothetical protein
MKTPRWISKSGSHARGAVVALLLLLLILLYPFETTIEPEWSLKVVNDAGAAVGDIKVTEHWQHYLLESSSHEETRKAGANGAVTFPPRSIWASLLGRGWAAINRIRKDGWHARLSPAASVVVWGHKNYATTVAVYFPKAPPQSHVMVPSIQ